MIVIRQMFSKELCVLHFHWDTYNCSIASYELCMCQTQSQQCRWIEAGAACMEYRIIQLSLVSLLFYLFIVFLFIFNYTQCLFLYVQHFFSVLFQKQPNQTRNFAKPKVIGQLTHRLFHRKMCEMPLICFFTMKQIKGMEST